MASRLRRGLVAAVALTVVSPAAKAQSVLLQIRPHVGDTLHVRLDQQVEMTGMPAGCGSQQGVSRLRARSVPANCADIRTMNTRVEVFSRAIARNATRDATDMLAITDSVRTSSGKRGADERVTKQPASRGPVEIRISTDGGVELGAGPASDEVRTLFGQMPATLSRRAVAVGEKWIHEMRVPLAGEPGATGRVRTTFQLDSLGRNGNVAYISMRGVLTHDHSDGSDSETSGSLTGTMQLDRRLAWITETRATIDVWSTVTARSSGQPMQVHTRVLQFLRVSEAR
jgi:hypothetical protein